VKGLGCRVCVGYKHGARVDLERAQYRTEWLNPETLIAYSPPGVGHYLDVQVLPFSLTHSHSKTHSLTHSHSLSLSLTHTHCTYGPERVYVYTYVATHIRIYCAGVGVERRGHGRATRGHRAGALRLHCPVHLQRATPPTPDCWKGL